MRILDGITANNAYGFNYIVVATEEPMGVENPLAAFANQADAEAWVKLKSTAASGEQTS